ncbi:hypothetical protein [Marinobacter bohaiensis]|uniref:hypothetical protein n=1 Tax=Marinobacter bohaiensis TaxID=2201898 RepID=UPI0013A70634|nr:hypothetical protein [Marinobacter bohaiensis]
MLEPEADLRYRVNKSELIWVLERKSSGLAVPHIEIVDSIERTVHEREGKKGLYVQYQSIWRPLHPASEFEELLRLSKAEKIYLFSNEWGVSQVNPASIERLTPAACIYTDESGFDEV